MIKTRHPVWVNKIFITLQGAYGTKFLNMYKTGQTLADGSDAGIQNAMHQWGERLQNYADREWVFHKALEVLPDTPPTLPEFLRLCQRAVDRTPTPKLERTYTAEELAHNKRRVAEMMSSLKLK